MAFFNHLKNREAKEPSLIQSLIPIIFLLALILMNVLLIEGEPLDGGNQLSLLLAGLLAGLIAFFNGISWETIREKVHTTIGTSLESIMILFSIGMLAGAWMLSGIIPTMIYYGLFILRPEYFLPAALIICAITSVATGSSWSTIATVGVALLGIGEALGFKDPLIAGAIISGAYFGDKISPLSDTTNLASGVVGVDLFKHIKYMMKTTVPTITITLLIFIGISVFGEVNAEITVSGMQGAIKGIYTVNPLLFIFPLITLYMIAKKVPAVVTLVISALLGSVAAIIFQPELITSIAGGSNVVDFFDVITKAMYSGVDVPASDPAVAELFATSGMAGMLNTIWLILMAMVFGGIMEAGGFLKKITESLLKIISSTGGLVSTTALNCIMFNIITADQYITLVLSGKMYSEAYKKQGLAPEVLSRTIEDSGTVTSVLVPWNSCGATQASVLGVATLAYLPFCFFCYLSPLMSMFFAWFNIKIRKINKNI